MEVLLEKPRPWRMDEGLFIAAVLDSMTVVARATCVGTTVKCALTRERKTMTKHERRRASKLCAWFNY